MARPFCEVHIKTKKRSGHERLLFEGFLREFSNFPAIQYLNHQMKFLLTSEHHMSCTININKCLTNCSWVVNIISICSKAMIIINIYYLHYCMRIGADQTTCVMKPYSYMRDSVACACIVAEQMIICLW